MYFLMPVWVRAYFVIYIFIVAQACVGYLKGLGQYKKGSLEGVYFLFLFKTRIRA